MRIREAVLQISGRIAKYATLAKSTGKGFDAIDGAAAGEDEPKPQEPARRMAWYAFRSVPPVGSECAVIAGRAGSTNKMIVGADHRGFGKTDMSEGEAQIFTRFGQSVFLDKDGATTSTAAGSTVKQDKDGNIVLTSKGGAVLTMDDSSKVSEHDELFKSTHYGGSGETPSAQAGAALGAAGSVLSITGTDSAFTVTMRTDPTVTTSGILVTVTFAKAYTKDPRGVAITAMNADAASGTFAGTMHGAAMSDKLEVRCTSAPTSGSITYKISCIVIE